MLQERPAAPINRLNNARVIDDIPTANFVEYRMCTKLTGQRAKKIHIERVSSKQECTVFFVCRLNKVLVYIQQGFTC